MGTLSTIEPDVRFLRNIGVVLLAATIIVGAIAGSIMVESNSVAETQTVAELGN